MPKSEVRALIKYEFDSGRKPTQALRNICASKGPGFTSLPTVKRWFKKFINGDESLADQKRSGRPPTIDENVVLEAIEADPTLSTRMLSADIGCSHVQISKILHQNGKRLRHGKWIPHDLTEGQKNQRLAAAQQLLIRQQQTPFLDRLVTCDEKWVQYKNPVRKNQWLSARQRPAPVAKPDWRQQRAMLCVWWWQGGIIYWELRGRGQTINAQVYSAQLDKVQQKLRTPGLAAHFRRGVILQQDNARPHVANITLEKINQLGWERLIHPPYSPDIAPSDFHLFASLAHFLSGRTFDNFNALKNGLQTYFDQKSVEFYRRGIELLTGKWQKIVNNNGCYFE